MFLRASRPSRTATRSPARGSVSSWRITVSAPAGSGEHEVEHFFEGPALGGERRDVLEDGPRRFGWSQHLTAPESWRGPTPGSPASPATTCPRSGTRETRPGIAGGP